MGETQTIITDVIPDLSEPIEPYIEKGITSIQESSLVDGMGVIDGLGAPLGTIDSATQPVSSEEGQASGENEITCSPLSRKLGELVVRIRQNDDTAWSELVQDLHYLGVCHTRKYQLSDADVAEVVSYSQLNAYLYLSRIREPLSMASWISRTAAHEASKIARRRNRDLVTEPEFLPESTSDIAGPEDTILQEDNRRLVRQAVQYLSPKEQRLINLLFNERNVPYMEISERLGIPIGSIGPTRGRIIARLRLILSNHFEELEASA